MGPALGPVISGFAVSAKGWRWSSWELLWLSAPIFIFLFLALPETSADTILLRRAERLRKVTGRSDLKSQSEINQASMTINEVAFEALVKPWEINALDPAVLFSTVYTALVYGIFYSFFESFPLVYPKIYGFNLGETGLPFLSVLVALGVCIPAYCAYFYYYAEPIMLSSPGFGQPEERLVPGLFASVFIPVGCFLFGKLCVSNAVGSSSLTHLCSLDYTPLNPLDRKRLRRRPQHVRNVPCDAMHFPVLAIHLPKILGISLCR